MTKNKSLLDLIDGWIADESTTLPVFSRTGIQIHQELQKADPDIHVIEKLILGDQALTTQVLKTANSTFYVGLTKVTTVRQAIIRMGSMEIANIVMMVTQHRNFKARTAAGRDMMDKLWRHSVGTAIGAQWVARELGYREMGHEAFTAGLLHDIGRLLLFSALEDIQRKTELPIKPTGELLRELLAEFHADYGYRLLETWNLPEQYGIVARDHHIEDFDRDNILLVIVRLVNQACHKLGIGVGDTPNIMLAATLEATLLGLSEITLAKLEIKLEDSLRLSQA